MSTIDRRISAGFNDGCWFEGNSTFKNNDIIIVAGYYDGTRKASNSFMRFDDIAVVKGSRINEAYLTITANYSHALGVVKTKICAIASDDASAPTSYVGAENAPRTTASVAWEFIPKWTAEGAYKSPNIAPVIQEIVNRSGWSSGHAIVIYWEDNGSTAVNGTVREGYPYEVSSTKCASLRIVSSSANAKTEYSIATIAQGVAGLKTIDLVGTSVKTPVEPMGLNFEYFSVYRTSASGVEYGDGYPTTSWVFSAIEQAQLTGLLEYLGGAQSASVYIRTRRPDRTYADYKAVMHRPKADEMTAGYLGRDRMWHNVTIRFTMLELQA